MAENMRSVPRRHQVPKAIVHNVDLTHIRVPEGLPAILDFLYLEILRTQPEDLISYAAVILEERLTKAKENPADKPPEEKVDINLEDPDVVKTANMMQAMFRKKQK